MPKKYPVELIQPIGSHNPKRECVLSSAVKDYVPLDFPHLNPVQSDFIPYLEDDNINVVVSAPTSSGKTLIAEFFISRGLKMKKKALYIAPMKALTDEKYYEWTEISHHFSTKKIEILTGDFSLSDSKRKALNEADIIFLTPEMFNSKCRYYDDHEWLHNAVIVVDETHLLGATSRGDKLEIGLIQYFEKAPETRALLLSATIPNVKDFADWLEHNTKRESVVINSTYRPCKLTVNSVPFSPKGKTYEEKEMARLEEVVKATLKIRNEPKIIFVGNKDFGRRISERLTALGVKNEFHNADKDREARNRIESGFRKRDFDTLIASSTVAWGCLSEDSVILTNSGFVKIKDLNNQNIDVKTFSSFGEKFVGDNLYLKSENESPKNTKRIVMQSGLNILATEEHVFPTENGNKELKDIKEGDWVYSYDFLSNEVDSTFDDEKIQECKNKYGLGFFYLLGAIAGDGWIQKEGKIYAPDICCDEKSLISHIEKICENMQIRCSMREDTYGTPHLILSKRKEFVLDINYFIQFINGSKILNYNLLLHSDKNVLYSIVAGLMDTDGGVDTKSFISFYNTSDNLVNFFVMAMKSLSIDTCFRVKFPNDSKNSFNIDKNNIVKEIVTRKKCYEIKIASTDGILTFEEKISKFMGNSLKLENLAIRVDKILHGGGCRFLIKGNDQIPIYMFERKDFFTKIKSVVEFCIKNGPQTFKDMKKKLELGSFLRKESIYKYFNCVGVESFRKNMTLDKLYPKDVILDIVNFDNSKDFVKIKINFGFKPELRATRNTYKIKKKNDSCIEKVRFILDEESTNRFYDLSIINDNYKCFNANGILTHNCNSPARYVLLAHTSYGLTKMEPQDVHQAIGRAGRLGYSDKGDALIFIQSSDLHAENQRIFGSYEVRSTLNDVNVMMFHILAYIDNGHIKTAQQLYDWHDRTLASVQKKRLGVEVFTLKTAQNVLENLEMRKMIKKDDKNEYSTTEIGQITARMYMSPLDVSDWFKNFSKVRQLNPKKGQDNPSKELVNAVTAMAFANCYSWARGGNCYISKNEQRAKSVWDLVTVLQKNKLLSVSNIRDIPYVKYGAIFYSLLNGNPKIEPQLQSIYSSLRQDFSRIISTMKQIDMRYGSYYKKVQPDCQGYGWGEEWDYLMFRLVYPGISPALWNLVSVDGIGQVYAEKLFKAGIKDKSNLIAETNREKIEEILGKKRAINVLESMGVHSDSSVTSVPKPKKSKLPAGTKVSKSKTVKGLATSKDLF